MARVTPWHSIKALVHHDNNRCTTGNNIEAENIRRGTGNRPLCRDCADLNRAGK